jgi:hypothetical protein
MHRQQGKDRVGYAGPPAGPPDPQSSGVQVLTVRHCTSHFFVSARTDRGLEENPRRRKKDRHAFSLVTNAHQPDLRRLRKQGLTESVKLHGRDRAVTLTERGRYIDLSPTALDSAIRCSIKRRPSKFLAICWSRRNGELRTNLNSPPPRATRYGGQHSPAE